MVPSGTAIFSSTEPKAHELATVIADASGGRVEASDAFRECRRASRGFLDSAAFEAALDQFYRRPDHGPDGWESAADAQRRIVDAAAAAIAGAGAESVVFCGHGTIGTLLKCHVAGRPVARAEDQRVMAWKGGGNCFVFELDPPRLVSDWVPMEDFRWPAG
jgi:broad specificity phosphatase PhoE